MRCFVSMGQWSWPKELYVINCVLNITALQSAFWLINGKCKVCKGQGCPRPLTKANAHSLLLPLHRQRPRPIRTGDIFVWNALWWPPYLGQNFRSNEGAILRFHFPDKKDCYPVSCYRSNDLITTNPTKSGILLKHSKLLKIGLSLPTSTFCFRVKFLENVIFPSTKIETKQCIDFEANSNGQNFLRFFFGQNW